MSTGQAARRALAILAVALAAGPACAQPAAAPPPAAEDAGVAPESLPQGLIIVVDDKTRLSGAASPIFLASNLNGWSPSDAKMRLSPRSDQRWQIQLEGPLSVRKLEFKFARGSWELEELDAKLAKIANRTLPRLDPARIKPGEPPIIEFTIEGWGDQRPEVAERRAASAYRLINATGDVRRLQVVGGGAEPAGGGRMRDALVWLPPGYDDPKNAGVRYPVLYLQDAQNVFEQLPGTPGEWRADETATALITSGKTRPFIIVALPHAGDRRIREYLPIPAGDFSEAGGTQYADWLITDVMPRVARAFRVATGPENTAIGGSSLGATVSLAAVQRHPGVFGGLLLESLPLRLGGEGVWAKYFDSVRQWPDRVAIGMGGQELGTSAERQSTNLAYVTAARDLAKRLQSGGPGAPRQVVLDIGADDAHNEQAWARRLPAALEFLFPPQK